MGDYPVCGAVENKHGRLWWAYWRFRHGPLQEARMRLWWPIYYRCKRPIIKFAHRFNWHHMRVTEIEGTKIARCDWCGLSDKVFDPATFPIEIPK